MWIAPTGRSVKITGFDHFRISGGKIAEMWQEMDQFGMMQQLGVIPSPGQGYPTGENRGTTPRQGATSTPGPNKAWPELLR